MRREWRLTFLFKVYHGEHGKVVGASDCRRLGTTKPKRVNGVKINNKDSQVLPVSDSHRLKQSKLPDWRVQKNTNVSPLGGGEVKCQREQYAKFEQACEVSRIQAWAESSASALQRAYVLPSSE